MSNHFKTHGEALLANGYLILPIRPGEKRPAVSAWQKARLGAGDIERFPGHGVGVLCGQGANPIVGVDIDISHPVIGQGVIDWCHANLGVTAERVGAAPRTLLVYRAAEAGLAKSNSVMFFDPNDPTKPSGKSNTQQVEILGLGQQFVAYHLHPDTGRDYEWKDLFGGIVSMPAADLPVVTEEQLDELLLEVARLVNLTDGVRVTASAASPMQQSAVGEDGFPISLTEKTGKPIEEIEGLLAFIDNKGIGADYDTWLKVGMALHHEYQGAPDALAQWKRWGAQATKDKPGEYDYKWASFNKSGKKPTTLRWVLKLVATAKEDMAVELRHAVVDDIKRRIEETTDPYRLTNDTAQSIRNLIPDDPAARIQIQTVFAERFKELVGSPLPAGELKALLAPPKADRVATVTTLFPLTEFGNTDRMLKRYGAMLMFVPELGTWYKWTGIYWCAMSEVEVEHFAKQTIRDLPKEIENHPDPAEFFQFCALSQQAKMVRNMVTLAQSDPSVVVPASMLDANPDLLGVANGVVNLATGQLIKSDQKQYITKNCGVNYDPNAKCPLFEQTILDCFKGSTDLVEYFMRCLGYTLGGRPSEDIMFIAFGNGSNGKSTTLGTVRRAFGSYARAADASTFVSDGKGGGNAGGAREDLLRLKGSRMVYVNEPDEGGELREGAVKAMTGGDAIPARGVYSKVSVEIVPTWSVWMPTNHKPIIKGSDNGVWRRMGMVPFERNFENDPTITKDPHREEKLIAELPGVLTLLVRSHLTYRLFGLQPPQSIKDARDSYRSQMDLLAEWIEECCETDSSYTVAIGVLWESWEVFARQRGILQYVRSSIALGRKLDAKFPPEKGTGGVRLRRGIRIKKIFGESALPIVATVADQGSF